jgi:hypothetical protein
LSTKPDSKFRWRNILYPDRYRLDFFFPTRTPRLLHQSFPCRLF